MHAAGPAPRPSCGHAHAWSARRALGAARSPLPDLARAYPDDDFALGPDRGGRPGRVAEGVLPLTSAATLGMPVCPRGRAPAEGDQLRAPPDDAVPAGEMKHGPIALLDEDTPVVAVSERLARARTRSSRTCREVGPRRQRDRQSRLRAVRRCTSTRRGHH